MKLISIKYSQFDDNPKEWNLDEVSFKNINLIAGKNATGKSKVLNIINALAKLLRGEHKPNFLSANFHVNFQENELSYEYLLQIKDDAVIKEELRIGEKQMLVRSQNGTGRIYAEKLKEFIDFQTPPSELTLHTRRDSIQHSYFEPLYEWAKSVYHYAFGTSLGKDTYALGTKDGFFSSTSKNTTEVINIYEKGKKNFGDEFKNAIKSDLEKVGYFISDLGIKGASNVKYVKESQSEPLLGIWVQENSLKCETEQLDMSQGMFRVLSLIIQLNYSLKTNKSSCILIDDIGEGLDFERSRALIQLLMSKIEGSQTQLIMSTNDRFVMNCVPLEFWTILSREDPHYCRVFNKDNAKSKFEEFKFTGLNNFDFFANNYFKNE